MDIKHLVRAAKRALEKCDTDAIKCIPRRGSHDSCVFPLRAEDRVQLSTQELFSLANNILPDYLLHYHLLSMNFMDTLGNVLLHLAAMVSDYDLIKLVLENRADVNSIGNDGRTALHVACRRKSLEIVKYLTEKSPGYILEMYDYDKNTPLDIACQYSCPQVVQYLLSQGCSVIRPQTLRGPSLLLQAVCNITEYAIPIVSLLLDAGVNVSSKIKSMFLSNTYLFTDNIAQLKFSF